MPPRHIVTGTDVHGRSCVVTDGPVPNLLPIGDYPGLEFARVWSIDSSGAATPSGTDGVGGADIYPLPGGSRFQHITYPSGFGSQPVGADTHPLNQLLMHRTDSIDFGVVLEGELTLVLEDGSETTLRVGDLIVQNAVMHGWRNITDRTAVALFVLVGTQPE